MYKKILFLLILYVNFNPANSQTCVTPGQTPVSAKLICSSETFSLSTPSFCGQSTIPTPCIDGASYTNANPMFFRFNCYAAGTLGFTITPGDLSADFNWQLFDITNTNPADIFTNSNLFVACNWSGQTGATGASITGTDLIVCAGTQPLFSQMPDLSAGRTYLLMIVNQTGSPAGYQLSFNGGTAMISDNEAPHMTSTDVSCDRRKISVRLNEQVKCNSLAANGSDFSINAPVNIISASPDDCTTEYGTPSFVLTLDQPLPLGSYELSIRIGSDANTLVDICSQSIVVGEFVTVLSVPPQFSSIDTVYISSCKPKFLELVFDKPILCSSIAADGSDFIITGPQALTGIPSMPNCSGTTKIVRLNFATTPISGTYQLRLAIGADGNTVINDCGIQTPVGSTVPFTTLQSVSATFTHDNNTSCASKKVSFLHDGANNVTSWNWNFGNGNNSTIANPVVNFQKGNYNVRLIVNNGICSDTSIQLIRIDDEFKAAIQAPSVVCPGDQIKLQDKSTGNINQWFWDFGNGMTSTLQNPAGFSFGNTNEQRTYTLRLVISNTTLGCRDTVLHTIKKLGNCLVRVPNAFTPNGDGKNDFLFPLNAMKADNLEFSVYNKFGQLVFFSKDWAGKWNGKIKGVMQDSGVYAWLLTYTDRDTGEKMVMRGTTLLLR